MDEWKRGNCKHLQRNCCVELNCSRIEKNIETIMKLYPPPPLLGLNKKGRGERNRKKKEEILSMCKDKEKKRRNCTN